MSEAEEEVPGGAGEDEFAGLPEDEEEFVDNEAEGGEEGEGDGDGDGDGDGEGEGEGDAEGDAEGEGEEGSADSSEEEGGSEQNEYEADGFVVDEEEIEGEGGDDSDQEVRKKRRKRRRSYKLDEEDYMLLEDNQVTGVRRPLEQRKRLKRRGETRTKAAGAKQLRDELFGGEGDLEDELADLGPEGGADGDRADREERRHRYDDDDFAGEGSDEMGDFIVGGENLDKRRARRDARVALEAGLTATSVAAANRMFGNYGELLDLHASHKMYVADATEEEEGVEEEEEAFDEELEEDGEGAERRRLERQEKQAAKKQQRLLQHVDPELVDSHFLRPHDHTIRSADLPERLQLLGKPVLEGMNDEERNQLLVEASRWVVDHLFGARSQCSKVRECIEDGVVEVTGRYMGPRGGDTEHGEHTWPPWMLSGVETPNGSPWLDLSNNRAVLARRSERMPAQSMRPNTEAMLEKWRSEPSTQEQLRQNVQAVLVDLFDKGEEVPVVAMYRKEDCGDLLSLRAADTPETTGNERKAGISMEEDKRFPKGTMQAKHRRIRRWDVLWAVYNAAVRFFDTHRRKQQRMDSYIKVFERSALDAERDAITICFNALHHGISTASDMDDIDIKFRHVVDMASAFEGLSMGTADGVGGEEGAGSGRKLLKRPGRANLIKRYLARGLGELTTKVFLSMVAFSENVQRLDKVTVLDDPAKLPEDWAEDEIEALGLLEEAEQQRYADICNPGGFLRAIRELIASDLAAEPILRSLVRGHVFGNATVSTKPTPAGEDVLDPFHPLGITKHLVDKQVATFEGTDTWLRILAAEKGGLVKVELEFKTHETDPIAFLGDVYLSENVSDAANAWNAWRKEVVAYAVREKIVPALLQELRTYLTATSIETALTQVQDAFWKFVSQPPVKILEVIDEPSDTMAEPAALETPRFVAVVWGAGGQGDGPTTIVQLDGNGNLKDLLTAPQLSGNVPRTVNSGDRDKPVFDPAADPKKSKDSHKIREKILEHKPNAILVATNAPQSKQIKDDMEKISQYTESDARFKDELLPHLENKRVDVFWSDHRLAALWANSDAAKAEFPDYSFLVRMAVGIGRVALDPLAILAVLCGPKKKDIFSLKMHDLQDMLPEEQLKQRLEQTLITGVAQVGVDINAMVAYPWRQGPLQFVPGLGPRKARALLAAIAASEDPFVKTRVDLLKPDANAVFAPGGASDMAQLGKNVFQNAAASVRVRHGTVAALQNEEEFDAVDDIRIHPMNEGLLQVVLDEAFPDLAEAGNSADVRTAIEQPNNLLALDLYGVAEHTNYKHKLLTLSDMLFELQASYGEVRLGSASPSEEQAFYLRHGETEDSLKIGRLVEGKVVWVGDSEVKVILHSNGMEAFIPQDQVTDGSDNLPSQLPQLSQLFKHGQTVTARISDTSIGNNNAIDQQTSRRRYNVTLSTRPSYVNDTDTWEVEYCVKVDMAYRPADKSAAAGGVGAATPSRRVPTARRQLQARPIEHPLWRNKRGAEVAAELAAQPAGSALFRPAMKPTVAERLNHISLSIHLAKLSTGPLILNVDIKEAANKPPKQARLMAPLRIDLAPKEEEQYDDLDEVVARYVEPLVDNVNQLFTHRKFVDGDSNNINNHIRQQLSQQGSNPNAGAYCVAIDAARPGSAYIAYGAGGPESSIYKEWFNITPKGYYFRGQHVSDVERVLDAFKRDPNYKKRQKADGVGSRMGGPPGAATGYGQAAAGAYGQPAGGYVPHGGYTPHQQQQPVGYGGYGSGGYVPGGQQPYRPAPAPAAAGGGYGRPPGAPAAAGPGGYGAPAPGAGGYGGVPQPYQSGYAPNPGYNQAGGYQQQPYYGQAR